MSRRSVARLEGPPPSSAQVANLLDGAVRAPNHYLTQPWRFIVLVGEALDDLAETFAERVRRLHPDAPDLGDQVARALAQPHRAPMIIVAVYRKSSHPRSVEVEDRYAMGAAVQNILLAAHSDGLGAYWRTGPAAEDEGVKAYLGLTDGEQIASFIYLGRVPDDDNAPPQSLRTPAREVTTWMGRL